MAEQSTAACRTLLQEAEEMARLTGRFQMREDAPVEAVAVLRRPAPAAAAPVAKAALRVVSRAGGAARKPVPVADDG